MNDFFGDDNINWANEARRANREDKDFTDVKYLEPYLPYIKDRLVVESGSNIGKRCKILLAASVKEYQGIDASSHALEFARRRNPGVIFIHLNLLALPCNLKADVFWFHTVLQHIHLENKKKLMPLLHCALNDPGYLIIEEKSDVKTITTFRREGWIDFIEPFGFKCIWRSEWDDPRMGYLFQKV